MQDSSLSRDATASLPETSRASRWRTRLANARPAWADVLGALRSQPVDRDAIERVLAIERGAGWHDEAHLRRGLRNLRTKIVATLVDRDLGGQADVAEVMSATTALAEIAIGEALTFLSRMFAARHGVPHGRTDGLPQDLMVIGMGKLGGGELNVSSDIDLVFVYCEEGETRALDDADAADVRTVSNEEFFTRLGRKLISALAELTADGFVFRVDMRLRPDGDSGPLVAHFAMLERYLVASARDWERFAWIKGRVVSPAVFANREPGSGLEELVKPFVYRRYLDFGAIDALRRLHGQIRDEAARREAVRDGRSPRAGPGPDPASSRIDVKLGRGGIREIEFIVQHFQLIRGGREPELQHPSTLSTLRVLVDVGLLSVESESQLREAYGFLRNVEHRLQYLDDAQTHTLPPRDAIDDCDRIATMCAPLLSPTNGETTFDALLAALEARRRLVARQFESVFGLDDEAPAADPDATMSAVDIWSAFAESSPAYARDEALATKLRARLVTLGFDPPEGAIGRLEALARSARTRTMAPATRLRLDSLVPKLIDAASDPSDLTLAEAARPLDATATLGRWCDLIEAIAGRSAYLALLEEFPIARRAVTRLLSASPWAAQYLTRHPVLLDELIAPRGVVERPTDPAAWVAYWRAVAAGLARQLDETASDTERQMDLLRDIHHVETFRLLIDDLDRRLSIESVSDQLSALADLILDAAIRACWSSFGDSGPYATEPAFAVIGYGKLGGKELGYASDLDLVFLYDERRDVDGDPASAPQRYARFAQRLNVWLTARTSAGLLFEIDLRLRPDGAAGLVVSSLAAWSRYERREHDVGAWTWEHQALTRARFSAGHAGLGTAFEAERVAILAEGGRDDEHARARLRDEIVAMRKRMHDGHPNRSGRFDLKHDTGGMVDIEFAVQYLVLAHGGAHRELLDNVGNIALLGRAAEAGLVDPGLAVGAADAYRAYRARQHASRLADPSARAARVEADAFHDERALVRRLWASLFA